MDTVNINIETALNDEEKRVLEQFKEFQKACIEKNEEKLNQYMHEKYVLIHMSGKTENKTEFIKDILDNTLNYYKSTIDNPTLKVKKDSALLTADITLDAMVYGMKGVWTLHSTVSLEKYGGEWLVVKWDN